MSNRKRKLDDSSNKIHSYFAKDFLTVPKAQQSKSASSPNLEISSEGRTRDFNSVTVHNSNSTFILNSKEYSSKETYDSKIVNTNLNISWKIISREHLHLKYGRLFSKPKSDEIFQRLENEVTYFSGDLLKVKVFGKVHNIPRKQVSFGDEGLSYSFSGVCIPAVPWSKSPIVLELKKHVESVTGEVFNFVLVNRYKDGEDHMGEHRDDEKDLVEKAPIASLSFGQNRDFIFKHRDSRGKQATVKIPPLTLELEHGSILLMEFPTNKYWYHSLPIRKKALNVRINLTFRKMVVK